MSDFVTAVRWWPVVTYMFGVVFLTPAFVTLYKQDEQVKAKHVIPAVLGWPFWVWKLFR